MDLHGRLLKDLPKTTNTFVFSCPNLTITTTKGRGTNSELHGIMPKSPIGNHEKWEKRYSQYPQYNIYNVVNVNKAIMTIFKHGGF
jgi:hypothetical protein